MKEYIIKLIKQDVSKNRLELKKISDSIKSGNTEKNLGLKAKKIASKIKQSETIIRCLNEIEII
jgi:hypothetical protein